MDFCPDCPGMLTSFDVQMYLVHPHSQHEMFILFDQPFFLSTIFLTLISLELHSTQLPFIVLINSCSIEKLISIK